MHGSHINTDHDAADVCRAASLPGRVRLQRLLAMVLATVGLIAGSLAAAAPASAATSGNVTFCLSYTGGRGAYANKPVYLYKAAPGAASWGSDYKTGTTNSQGCATWRSVPTGYHYATQGYWKYSVGWNIYYYTGWTGSAYLGGNGGTVTQPSGQVAGAYLLY
jgi:hypothetical protein